jgi:hypothetical protein
MCDCLPFTKWPQMYLKLKHAESPQLRNELGKAASAHFVESFMIRVAGYESMHNDELGYWQYIIQHAPDFCCRSMALALQTRHVPTSRILARIQLTWIAGQLHVQKTLSLCLAFSPGNRERDTTYSGPKMYHRSKHRQSHQAYARFGNLPCSWCRDSITGWLYCQKPKIFNCPVAMASTCPHQQIAKQKSIEMLCK